MLLKFPSRAKPQVSEPPMVHVYLRGDTVYMHPLVKTSAGVFNFIEPVVESTQHDRRLATNLLDLLSVRRTIVPHPTSWKGLTDPLTKAAKVRSFNAFASSAKLVSATLENNGVSLLPTRNGGSKEGFIHLNHKVRSCPPTEGRLFEALQTAFAECE